MKEKAFFIIFEGISFKQIKNFFGKLESDFKQFVRTNTRHNYRNLITTLNKKTSLQGAFEF